MVCSVNDLVLDNLLCTNVYDGLVKLWEFVGTNDIVLALGKSWRSDSL